MDHNDSLLQFLMHFIFAGSSALILSIAYIYTDFWFIYIFALLPFLYRVVNTDLRGSVIAGLFLALSFVFVISTDNFINSPIKYVGNILLLCFTFILFSAAVNRLKRYIVLSVLLFAALCLPLEYFHKSYFEFNSVFASLKSDAGFIFRAASLFGFLSIAFLIIAVNSLLLFLIEILCRMAFSGRFYDFTKEFAVHYSSQNNFFRSNPGLLPDPRGPPLYIQC
ncbi:MAG: hypothetical protein JSU85_01930 [Candidatus Zixiibacteriota bacterium]|nr:MAG: hypothetical protein JSU85_01930 [candidate division Zixibacteria bacterium]